MSIYLSICDYKYGTFTVDLIEFYVTNFLLGTCHITIYKISKKITLILPNTMFYFLTKFIFQAKKIAIKLVKFL